MRYYDYSKTQLEAKAGLTSAPSVPVPKTADVDDAISVLAKKFSVNYTPMKYRLHELNLVSREELSLEEYFC